MENLFESGRFSDFRLIAVTGKVFNVHKFALAGEYFDENFMSVHDL